MDLRFITTMPRYRLVLWVAFLGALLFFIFQMRTLPGGAQRGPAPQGFELYDSLLHLIRNDYLEERDPARTAEGAYRGLVNSLDPLSAYLDKDLAARHLARDHTEKETGLVLFKRYGSFPQVVGVADGSPAAGAGLRAGDILSAIDGRNTLNMSLVEAEILLRSRGEEPVEIKALRGSSAIEISLGRSVLFPKPWSFSRPAGGPAVLRVHYFAPGLVPAVKREVVPALKNGGAPLVLDLRDCREGGLDEARALVNLFLKAPAVGWLEKKGGLKEEVACPDDAPLRRTPLAVWVSPTTMAAAEIAAGILQELRGAKLVGSPTPGLGGHRDSFVLEDESLVLLTSAVFSLPSGRSLWGTGLTPDVPLEPDARGDKDYLEKTRALFTGL